MRRTMLLAVILPFVSAFLGSVLAFGLVRPSQTSAQSGELHEIRASAFVLVGPDGTVLANLAPARFDGAARLNLHDADGTRRLSLNGAGSVVVWDQDGETVAFRAGRLFSSGATGLAPVNGVELGPGGSISMLPFVE